MKVREVFVSDLYDWSYLFYRHLVSYYLDKEVEKSKAVSVNEVPVSRNLEKIKKRVSLSGDEFWATIAQNINFLNTDKIYILYVMLESKNIVTVAFSYDYDNHLSRHKPTFNCFDSTGLDWCRSGKREYVFLMPTR